MSFRLKVKGGKVKGERLKGEGALFCQVCKLKNNGGLWIPSYVL